MDAVARVAIPLLEYAPITQNSLRTGVPNLRVGSDEGSRAYSLEIANDRDNLDTVIESAYRQIFSTPSRPTGTSTLSRNSRTDRSLCATSFAA